MKTEQYSFTLPVPPSVNRMYAVSKWGHVFMVRQGKQYKAEVRRIITQKFGDIKLMDSPVQVELTVFRPAKRGDLDNYMKVLLDSLQGCIYSNDRQIHSIIAKRQDSKQNPRVEVTVRAIH